MLLCACESDKEKPSLTTCSVVNTQVNYVSSASASISFVVKYEYSSTTPDTRQPGIKKYGVYYSTSNQNPGHADGSVVVDNSQGATTVFNVTVPDLRENQHYYARGFIRDALGSDVLGNVVEFTTAGSSKASLNDFLGTYKCRAHRLRADDYVTWNNIVVTSYEAGDHREWVRVEGLLNGHQSFTALGRFDTNKGYIRLWGGWYYGYTYTIASMGDTLLYPIFYPVYATSSTSYYLQTNNPSDDDGGGEILLKRNSDGTLYMTASEKADKNNRYANGYLFDYYRVADEEYSNHQTIIIALDGTTFTKTSSAHAPARLPDKRMNISQTDTYEKDSYISHRAAVCGKRVCGQ